MKKTLTWITWLSLSAVSPFALAVGLGQASVSSYLNAPLEASIPLLEGSDYALDDIRISIAEPADFTAAGLEWTALAASVRVQVVEQQGQRQVRLSSGETMQEPWLDLLLAVEFPGGQQFDDITLLFDPQGYSEQAQTNPSVVSATPNPAPTEAGVPRSAPPVRVSNSERGNGSNAYVGSGDTLWGVAERIKPDEVSVQQMMVALLEANPAVFPSGNIHEMRAGQTLRIPDKGRILARSHRDADTAIEAMNDAWRARRDGPLQTVVLPEIEDAAISDTAVAATQAIEAAVTAETDSALAAGGAETGEPETDEPEVNDQAVLEEATEAPEALTRAELTEQLRLSQATLEQILEERALMRAELNELRGEVASLTQALSDAMAAREQEPTPLAANMGENQGVPALLARYQWPLALAAIALLVALLVWLRKRREETWEDVSFAEPVIKPTVSPRVEPKATPMPEAVPATHPAQAYVGGIDEPHNHDGQLTATRNELETDEPEPKVEANAPIPSAVSIVDAEQWLVDDQGQTPSQDDRLRYEKSQASGLAEQGQQRRLGLHVSTSERAENISLSPPQSSVPMSQLLASLSAVLPVSDRVADAHEQQAETSYEPDEDAGHRFIDYHPPILNSTLSGASKSQGGLRNETPMQPTVEFATESPAPPIKKPRRPIEEEWEIEEVAFKPRGLDNSEPSKSSK